MTDDAMKLLEEARALILAHIDLNTLYPHEREVVTGIDRYLATGGWMPIETAPRDGTGILLHGNIAPGCPGGVADEVWPGNCAVAAWWSGENGGNGSWICYMSMVRDPDLHFEPTHWQPLPPLPTERKACSTDPNAPHGFDRNSSHSENRYVCECEHYEAMKPTERKV